MGINPWFCGFRDSVVNNITPLSLELEKKKKDSVVGPWELEPFRHSDLLLFLQYSLRFFICPFVCLPFTQSSNLSGPLTSLHVSTSHSYVFQNLFSGKPASIDSCPLVIRSGLGLLVVIACSVHVLCSDGIEKLQRKSHHSLVTPLPVAVYPDVSLI